MSDYEITFKEKNLLTFLFLGGKWVHRWHALLTDYNQLLKNAGSLGDFIRKCCRWTGEPTTLLFFKTSGRMHELVCGHR